MATATRQKPTYRECRAPDCSKEAMEARIFCETCQTVLDRVRESLNSGPRQRGNNGKSRVPTVKTVSARQAATFDRQLANRDPAEPLTEGALLTRAVRIIQLRAEGRTDEEIVEQLTLTGPEEIDTDLERYRKRVETESRNNKKARGRNRKLDEALLKALKENKHMTRPELADHLGVSYTALAARITRLKREGHHIPDARRNPRPTNR